MNKNRFIFMCNIIPYISSKTVCGHRVTLDQPNTYARTVYMIGGCTVFGIGASDGGTIVSYLQRLFNSKAPSQGIRVENYGYFLAELDAVSNEGFKILQSLPLKQGDIVLYFFDLIDGMKCIDIREEAHRPHNYGEVFFDNAHLTHDGNRLMADKLFEALQENYFYLEATSLNQQVPVVSELVQQSIDKSAQMELLEYKQILTRGC